MSGGEPVGLRCPGCECPPGLVLSGQAWCGNEDCAVLVWDPSKSLTELAANVQQISERGDDR